MPAHSSPQQQTTSTWSPTSNQAKSGHDHNSAGFAQQSNPLQAKPFVTAPKAASPATSPDLQARLDEKPASKLLDLTQINLFAGAAPAAPPVHPVQRKSEPDEIEPDKPEAEDKIQRKCADCGAVTGDDDDPADKPIQPKLTIGQPGDRYEQEADQMAAKVVSMPEPVVQRSPFGSFLKTNKVQRKGGMLDVKGVSRVATVGLAS